MYTARLADAARADIAAILSVSEYEFGQRARLRYELLLASALDALQIDPRCAGVQDRPEIGPGVQTFHLIHVRKKARSELGWVRRPRHLLVFRIDEPGLIVVGRVIHDAMELALHVPVELSGNFDT